MADYYNNSNKRSTNNSRQDSSRRGSRNSSGSSPSRRSSFQKDSQENTFPVEGYLQIYPDFGVLRVDTEENDVYVSRSQIFRFDMRMGDLISGVARAPKEGERYLSLLRVEKVAGEDPEKAKDRPFYEDLTPIFPNEAIKMETTADEVATRIVDLFCPIGKGQRGLIVSPPFAGKTWLLKSIANGITANYKDIVLKVVLIGERPEEVTDMARNVKGEVLASNFDAPSSDHVQVAEMALERAKRLAESGKDVVILLDSITRLARAYNLEIPPSGRTLSGGFDPKALFPPKKFFGAARNFEKSGSLTIIATALVDTGSKMDDLVYEEFKGTGNMELHLDRKLAERRIFPAINIKRSNTRHEEKLYAKDDLERVYTLRRMVDLLKEDEATSIILQRLKETKSNKEFLTALKEG